MHLREMQSGSGIRGINFRRLSKTLSGNFLENGGNIDPEAGFIPLSESLRICRGILEAAERQGRITIAAREARGE